MKQKKSGAMRRIFLLLEMLVNYLRFGWSDDFRKTFQRGLLNAFDGFQFQEQFLCCLLSHPFNIRQFRVHKSLLELLPVEGDGKAMHLILDMRQQAEHLRIGFQSHHTGREAIQKFIGAVTVILCQTRNGDVDVQLVLNYLPHHFHLPLASVGDDKVGQRLALLYHRQGLPPS